MVCPRFCIAAVVAVGLLFGSTGCGSGGGSTPSNPPTPLIPATTRSTYGPLEFTLVAPDTVYKTGDAINLAFTVKNVAATPVNIVIDGAPYYANVFQGSKPIMTGPGGRIGVIYTITLAPGESKTYTTGWAQQNHAQETVPRGKYQFYARLNSFGFTGVNEQSLPFSRQDIDAFLGPPPIELTLE